MPFGAGGVVGGTRIGTFVTGISFAFSVVGAGAERKYESMSLGGHSRGVEGAKVLKGWREEGGRDVGRFSG